MLIKTDLMKKLKNHFSINEYEVKVWTALLARGESTAGDLSEISTVPRSRTYDILESLEKKGFVNVTIGKPIKYKPVAPSKIIEAMKKQVVKDSQVKINEIDKIKDKEEFSEISKLYTAGVDVINPLEISTALKGQKNILNHLHQEIANAKKTVNIVTSTIGLQKKSEELITALKKAKQNGAKIKIAAPITKECKDAVEELSKIADIKDSKELSARFSVIDGQSLTYMILNNDQVHENYDIGIHSTAPLFASALDQMFENQFKGMKSAKTSLK